jgi:hypothetical protein
MADLALSSSNASTQTGNNNRSADVENSIEQLTYPAAVAMDELTPVYLNSSGKWAKADASAAGTADVFGLTVKKVAAGEPVTAISKGIVGGFVLTSLAYGASVYLSDTEGKVADAAGTVSVKIGRVVPVYGQVRGNSPAKMVQILR